MHVLVTGAAGFIGSHTCVALIRKGWRVTGLDNLNDYYDPQRKRANLVEVEAEPGAADLFDFVYGDVRDRDAIETLFRTRHFDAVVHLAAMAGVRASVEDPHLYCEVNITGTLNLLESSRKHGTGTFVISSTSSAYGNTHRLPFEESDTCDRPLAPYAATKRAAEMLGYTWSFQYGIHFTVLRFFTVYGPRGRPDMMAYKLLDSIYLGREVPLYNNGQMHRDWTYVEDVVAGIVASVERSYLYEVINLGRGEPMLLADFVRIIEKLAGHEARLVSRPMEKADAVYTYADIRKARELLGYVPQTSVQAGVEKFYAWYMAAVRGGGSCTS